MVLKGMPYSYAGMALRAARAAYTMRLRRARIGGKTRARRQLRRIGNRRTRAYSRRRYTPRRAEIGEYPGKRTSRHYLFPQTATGSTSKLLNIHDDVVNIPNFSDPTKGRISNRILITGIKLYWDVNIKSEALQSHPWIIHIAVLNRKSGGLIPSGSNFFKSQLEGEQYQDFDTSINGLTVNTSHINTDDYVVLLHKKITLWAVGAAQQPINEHYQQRHGARWIPVKRQIAFDNDLSAAGTDRIYIVSWADRNDSASGTGLPNCYDLRYRAVTFFQNSNS